ncbi:hypothetical protein [Rubinisphaera brasiliensis]|uniref:Signal peptide-domain containing protein n=1 Tax=Rubinisphaera brasiliensis (strain ATCC 49424 / DSM 5305 / JCM 21570 / IAM 15109 / NBRC 103401 / IFAM 1448) TaxID=756272 RepID=F0STJ2_RUBBR|nr:hypothetical protein [Rubinisphaera brasiliensis]ADY61461.1 hypothetical protein Plabr_3882 [Rubinisphaera brasiliensis DSM 5305]
MRCIAALALSLFLPVSAFAYSPKQPEHHKRYSPNGKYFIDFNPETDLHTVYATDSPDVPLWSIQCDTFWPYKQDESDGCLFVADDGSSIAGLTWVHREGKPPDYRTFDGVEFWGSDGSKTVYRQSRLRSGRIPVVDFPVRIVWLAIHGSNHRGGNLTRDDSKLHVTTFGMRSFTFSLQTGQITGWNLNANYFAYLGLVYAIPVCFFARWIARRQRGCTPSTAEQRNPARAVLVNNVGSLLVLLNSLGFAFGVYLDSFGGTLDQIGAQFCRLTYPIAFVLVPVTFAISIAGLASRPRRFDMLGPWLAILSVFVLVAILNPY